MIRCISFISLFLLLLSFTACHKEPLTEFDPGPLTYGVVSAQINGADWKASTFVDTFILEGKNFLSFSGYTFSEKGFFRDQLDISPIPLEIGIYDVVSQKSECGNINTRCFFFLWAGDGDALAATYSIDEDKKNQLGIEEVDLVEGKVKGNFSLNFVLHRESAPGFEPPEKLKIRKGCFDIRLP